MFKGIAASAGLLAATIALAQPPAKPESPKGGAPAAPKAPDAPKKIEGAMEKNILATAATTGNHTTFLAAVKAAGLEDALNGKGPFTVFAPSDEAFKKLPPDALADLLKPENKAKLANILKGHVLSGSLMAADVTKLNGKETEKSLEGHPLKIEVKDGKVLVGNNPKAMATVTKADVKASNGVIHVIDTVIMPHDNHGHDKDQDHKAPAKHDAPAPKK